MSLSLVQKFLSVPSASLTFINAVSVAKLVLQVLSFIGGD
jgi:hypothetical protein